MDFEVDARGQQCPIPVVRAKAALKEIPEGTVRVLVDNTTAVQNLQNLAKSLNCASTVEELGEAEFAVNIEKGEDAIMDADVETTCAVPAKANRVVVISSATMGAGSDELGATLMKGFIFALTQQDELPQSVLFYNGGVNLTCEGSASLDDLRGLAEAGVEILSCGTCLNHYGLGEKLAVGEVTNMYVIVEKQMKATVVVRP